MLAVGIAGLLLLSWPPADWLFSRPLEVWYPVRPYPAGFAEAIVVLSSSIDPPTYSRPYSRPDETTFHRCLFAAWLYRNWKPLPVLACGGRGATREPYSISMQRMLLKEGIPASMIWTEEFSHNTRENALFGARILRQHGIQRIALVVEAQSMLRAGACFRKLGMEVTPAASGFRGLGPLRDELMPSWTAVHRNAITTHEIGGLIWYWLRGWI
jgi:uncharacterized SAM-binding protein YcdF (DUF218 family)